jgi:hypothetical protein
MQMGEGADILRPIIWSRVSDLMRFRDGTAMMQRFCPRLSLLRRAGFTQNNNPPNEKVQTHRYQKRRDR